jgi:hypothetical protein
MRLLRKKVIRPTSVLWLLPLFVVLLTFAHIEANEYLIEETITVKADGKEVFASRVLDPNYYYLATVKGTITEEDTHWNKGGENAKADALHFTDWTGSFTRHHNGLSFSIEPERISSDRADHRYIFRLAGNDEKISIRFFPPFTPHPNTDAKLSVQIALGERLPLEKPSPSIGDGIQEVKDLPPYSFEYKLNKVKEVLWSSFWWIMGGVGGLLILFILVAVVSISREAYEERLKEEQVRQREVAQRERQEQLAREKEEREDQELEEFHQSRLRELIDLYEGADLYDDEQWFENKARKHCKEIVNQKQRIIKEFKDFHGDTAFIDDLKQQAPHIYRRATWEIRLLRKAEQIYAQQPPQRPKPSPEQVTEKIVRQFRVQLQDETAVLKAGKAWMEEMEEELLADIEDEAEREQMRLRLQGILNNTISSMNQGKEDSDGKIII